MRYLYIVMVLVALASNLGLCFVSPLTLFAWYVEAPVLIADTLWVSWALHSTGAIGSEFFLLYCFVLFLATIGENLMVVLAGSTMISAANVYLVWDSTAHAVLAFRVVFFYVVALFYGCVLGQIRHERQRADKGLAWAHELRTPLNIVSARDLAESQQVEFRVDDTGPGIPEEHLSRIFEPFTQLGTACAPEAGGVGLGLAIVQRHLALRGASIAVNSIPGSGTSFRVTLPYRPARTESVARAA